MLKLFEKIKPFIPWSWRYFKQLLNWVWNHLSHLGVITAIIFSIISMRNSGKQFQASSDSSDSLIIEIKRLQDSTISQAERNKVASDRLIESIKELQKINDRLIGEQNRIAKDAAREMENKERPNLISTYRAGLMVKKVPKNSNDYEYHGFSPEFQNIGKRRAGNIKRTTYILTEDTLFCKTQAYDNPFIEPDNYDYEFEEEKIILKRGVETFYVKISMAYDDINLNKHYNTNNYYCKFIEGEGYKYSFKECTKIEIIRINNRIH